MASEKGVDLGSIQGSGPGGRIIKRDIEGAQAGGSARPAAAAAPRAARAGDFEDVPLTQIRKTIAKRLSESIGPIPTFYLTAEFDLTRVTEMRSAMAEMGDEFKVSINDILMKAVATALSQHPEVNAHWLGDKIRLHNRVHLGMAVANSLAAVRGGARFNTVGAQERAATAGASFAARNGLYLEGHFVHGGSEGERGWGFGARVSF